MMSMLQSTVYIYIYEVLSPPQNSTKKFSESIESSFILFFDSWVIDWEPFNSGNEYQLDIRSASNINMPLYLIGAHQETEHDIQARPPNQFSNAIFDNVDVREHFIEIDGIRYPKNSIEINYSENKC